MSIILLVGLIALDVVVLKKDILLIGFVLVVEKIISLVGFFCFNCQAPKPTQPQPPPSVQPIRPIQMTGDWICPKCNEHNFARRYVCFNCQEAKPENATTLPPPDLGWGLNNQNIQTSTQVMAGDWFCNQCSAHNFARRMTCYSCGSTKEVAVQ
jgi:hypothetical protein